MELPTRAGKSQLQDSYVCHQRKPYPASLRKKQTSLVYASEADVLNMALFGMTAKEWRDADFTEKVAAKRGEWSADRANCCLYFAQEKEAARNSEQPLLRIKPKPVVVSWNAFIA